MTHDISYRNALGAVAHAQYHVTCAQEVTNNYIYGIPDTYLQLSWGYDDD